MLQKLKSFLIAMLRRVAPGVVDRLGRVSHERRVRRFGRLHRTILERLGPEVSSGPFTGMTYAHPMAQYDRIPMLLGAYEAELAEVVERIVKINYATIVDIGCAEGYYAVGLALRMPDTIVHAFDTDSGWQRACRQMSDQNRVADRVHVGGMCTPAMLQQLIDERTLVICDIEGSEIEALDPSAVPGLTQCDILVELHDVLRPGASAAIKARFAATHDLHLFSSGPREVSAYPQLAFLGEPDRQRALREWRAGPQDWFFMTRRV